MLEDIYFNKSRNNTDAIQYLQVFNYFTLIVQFFNYTDFTISILKSFIRLNYIKTDCFQS